MTDSVQRLIALGREHYNAGEHERAEPYLAEAAAANPSFPDLYNMLGLVYHALSRFSDAEEAFETALRLNPRYTEAALNLVVTYNDRGKYDRAREVYTRAVAASSGPSMARDRGVPTPIASSDRFARGKLANMHGELGAAYVGLTMYEEAVREYTHALKLCPDFADLRVRLGNVYRDMSAHEDAIREFEHAKRLRPDYIPARIHLGVTLFSLGRPEAARAEWEEVLSIDPTNRSAQLYLRVVSDANGPRPGSALPPPPQ